MFFKRKPRKEEEKLTPAACDDATPSPAIAPDSPDKGRSVPTYSGLAIASLASGVASLALIPPFVFGILALICGGIDMGKSRRSGIKVHIMTLAGIALGTIGLVLGIVLRIVI